MACSPSSGGGVPLVVVHGGPGMTHDYLLDLHVLSRDRMVLFYDQIGNGRSQPVGKPAAQFMSLSTMLAELEALLRHLGLDRDYLLMGHSAGGCVALEHALQRPQGLRGLILADAFASGMMMQDGMRAWLDDLPTAISAPLLADSSQPSYGQDPEFSAALGEFFSRHVCRVAPPEHLLRTLAAASNLPEVQHKMMGKSLFDWTGELASWSVVERLEEIRIPVLAYGGRWDEAHPDCLDFIGRSIPNCRSFTFNSSSHLPHIEETEACIALIEDFISSI